MSYDVRWKSGGTEVKFKERIQKIKQSLKCWFGYHTWKPSKVNLGINVSSDGMITYVNVHTDVCIHCDTLKYMDESVTPYKNGQVKDYIRMLK